MISRSAGGRSGRGCFGRTSCHSAGKVLNFGLVFLAHSSHAVHGIMHLCQLDRSGGIKKVVK